MRIGTPWNWYKLDSRQSLKLLFAYSDKIENQITTAIDHFKENKGRKFIVLSKEERVGQDVEYYEGLDSMSWDLNGLFECYFPNLQRKSAFLTMYAFLEHELEKLARKLHEESELTAELEDIAGRGITRSLVYMQKIVNLTIDKNDSQWQRISEINQLRNLIIHNDGHLSDHNGKLKKESKVLRQIAGHLSEKDGELIISSTFLKYVAQKFDDLFQYLDKAIQTKYPIEFRKRSLKKI